MPAGRGERVTRQPGSGIIPGGAATTPGQYHRIQGSSFAAVLEAMAAAGIRLCFLAALVLCRTSTTCKRCNRAHSMPAGAKRWILVLPHLPPPPSVNGIEQATGRIRSQKRLQPIAHTSVERTQICIYQRCFSCAHRRRCWLYQKQCSCTGAPWQQGACGCGCPASLAAIPLSLLSPTPATVFFKTPGPPPPLRSGCPAAGGACCAAVLGTGSSRRRQTPKGVALSTLTNLLDAQFCCQHRHVSCLVTSIAVVAVQQQLLSVASTTDRQSSCMCAVVASLRLLQGCSRGRD